MKWKKKEFDESTCDIKKTLDDCNDEDSCDFSHF